MFNIPEASLTSDWQKNSVTSLQIGNVENNESNRGQKYPLQGVTRFNQVVINFNKTPIGVNAGGDCVTLRYGSVRDTRNSFAYNVMAKLTFRFHLTICPENLSLKA